MSEGASRFDRFVIFLDIDGVLLPVSSFTFGGGELSEECVHLFEQIIDGCGGVDKVSIILSSTWRNFPSQVELLNRFIEKTSAGKVPRVAGGTPNGTPTVTQVTYYAEDPSEQRLVRDRVDEIERWIRTHMEDFPEACGGRWFAIDDMQLDVDARMRGHFVQTATDTGLTAESVRQTLSLLASLPDAATAATNAAAARVDPAVKDAEIAIWETQCGALTAHVSSLQAEVRTAQHEAQALRLAQAQQAKTIRELERQLEEARYRLAQYDFAKRSAPLREAVAALATTTGKQRQGLEQHVRCLIELMRRKRELERRRRAERKGKGPNV